MKIRVANSSKDLRWLREPPPPEPQRASWLPAWLAFYVYYVRLRIKVSKGSYHPTFPVTMEWRRKYWQRLQAAKARSCHTDPLAPHQSK